MPRPPGFEAEFELPAVLLWELFWPNAGRAIVGWPADIGEALIAPPTELIPPADCPANELPRRPARPFRELPDGVVLNEIVQRAAVRAVVHADRHAIEIAEIQG